MKIKSFESYEEMSNYAKDIIIESIHIKNDLLFCGATGDSPTGTYLALTEEYRKHPPLFSEFQLIKLDEWGGIANGGAGTCESYLQNHLIKPLNIPKKRYISFPSNSNDANRECKLVSDRLEKEGPIDVCILGLGRNGHIAFNEPADFLNPCCHIADLTPSSLQHNMTLAMNTQPTYGLTLGMADILSSKKIILLVTGNNKNKIFKQFLSQRITTQLPASFLWLHPDTICLIDKQTIEE